MSTTEDARRMAEHAARTSYGRLVAILSSRGGDIAAAEDALSEAFASALLTWPEKGVPDNPDGWLMTAARRGIGHQRRHGEVRDRGVSTLALLHDERQAGGETGFGDERLKLLFVCTHPAIDESAQAPLMLQTVLGLDASRIAACFLVSPAAMGQRLVRAKTKIRDAGVRFEVPEDRADPARLTAILSAIYAAYGTAWDDIDAAESKRSGLSEEALWLGRLVVDLVPESGEAKGLLALMLYCESRLDARRDAAGAFVPLKQQDPAGWYRPMISEAEQLLRSAAALGQPGRFQIEAAIQSLHVEQAVRKTSDPRQMLILYNLLVRIAPSIGAEIARAVVICDCGRPDDAFAILESLADRSASYQPWWVARAHVLTTLHRDAEAIQARTIAAGLTSDLAVRRHLLDFQGVGDLAGAPITRP